MFVRRRSWSCALLVVAWTGVAPAAAAPFTPDPALRAAAERGGRLTDDAAKQLEAALLSHPDDATAQAELLGYYYDRSAAFPQRRLSHVLWMIHHRPADPMTPAYGSVNPLSDAPGHATAAAAWDEQVAARPTDVAVLADAAAFFDDPADVAKSQDLLARAMAAEPAASAWPARLAGSLERQATRQPDAALYARALGLRQQAYKLTDDRTERFHLLIGIPGDAYGSGDLIAAKRQASRLLETAGDFPADPQRPDAVHRANIVLGEVALHAGSVDRSETYLAAAAQVPTSPTLAATGPDLALAKELLARGERSAVRDYLAACETVWPGGRERLKAWVATLDANGTPDFGP